MNGLRGKAILTEKPKNMSVEKTLIAKINTGDLTRDESQLAAAGRLDTLLKRLEDMPAKHRFFRAKPAPKGLYLWGGVGRGKSMLMDIFFDLAPVEQKKRVHFHAFMLDVHARINAWRKMDKAERRATGHSVRGAGDDPIAPTAKAIAQQAKLLCFDEFHVTDITDAMILSRLFEDLFERGVVVLATSNREPDDLYRNGLNRGLFLPFIELLKTKMEIFEFPGAVDHRLRQLTAAPVYYAPLGPDSDAAIEAAWQRLIGPATPKETVLTVQGRELILRRTAAGTARASFERLCGRPLGPADYLRLANAFQTLILENVPVMDVSMRNEAKRFVTLVDALYETRTKLIMSAQAQPDQLYVTGDGSFEFARTASRLVEMRSEDYLAARRLMAGDEEGISPASS